MKKLTIEYCTNMLRDLTTIRIDKIKSIEGLISGTKVEINGMTYELSDNCMFINDIGVYIWLTDEYSKSVIEIMENPEWFGELLKKEIIWNTLNCLHQLDEIINVYESKIKNTYNYFDTYHPRSGVKVYVTGMYFEPSGTLKMFGTFNQDTDMIEFFMDHDKLKFTGGLYEY